MPEPAIDIEVMIDDPSWRSVPRVKSLVARAAAAALGAAMPARVRAGACVALVGDKEIARLNHDFRGEPKPTDVLAFPQLPGGTRSIATRLRNRLGARERLGLGDIVVAFGVSTRGARESKVTLAHHVAHLVVHGALHLLGHDHAAAAETARMRALERRALVELCISDPYRAADAAAMRRSVPAKGRGR
jgi:probable rRNA maturation factor